MERKFQIVVPSLFYRLFNYFSFYRLVAIRVCLSVRIKSERAFATMLEAGSETSVRLAEQKIESIFFMAGG